ncbi:hypothetical protein FMM05_02550 [Flavobacterium zepuense]|uniref:Type IV leader peptidase family protein n=1 Tax=Flavobacterium zepuense TaxID=2593302 RepID=A0A552VAS1_9FLAO|nr:hypothetical protein FMM05_02550 [Flavobacterium zepuense]
MILSIITTLLCLLIMFYQDVKYRHIHILLPIVLFISGCYLTGVYLNNSNYIILIYNSLFFVLTFLILFGYMSFKNKSVTNPFENYFGIGDLIFYLAVTPFFVFNNYILYFIFSLVFSIVLYYIFKKMYKSNATIPLAGYASLLLTAIIAIDLLTDNYNLTLIR